MLNHSLQSLVQDIYQRDRNTTKVSEQRHQPQAVRDSSAN